MKRASLDPGKRLRAERGIPTFPAVDGLRWVAVVSVIAFHVGGLSNFRALRGTPGATLIGSGAAGVDFLFILSGFVMFLPAAARRGDLGSTRSYAIRRIARIVPAYWVCLVVLIAAYPLLDPTHQPEFTTFGAPAVAAHFAFLQMETGLIPSLASRIPIGFNLDGAVWTLSVEVAFYVALPFVARAFYRRPWLLASFAFVLSGMLRAESAPLARAWLHLLGSPTTPTFVGAITERITLQFPGYLQDFAAGMLSAYLVVRIKRKPVGSLHAWWALAAAAGSVIFLALYYPSLHIVDTAGLARFHIDVAGETLVPLALGVLLTGILLAPPRAQWPLTNRLITRLGETSYGTYLWHIPLLLFGVVTLGITHSSSIAGYLVPFAYVLGTACVAGWLSYVVVETPIRTRAQRLARRAQSRASGDMPRATEPARAAPATSEHGGLNRLWFLTASGGNHFMTELLEALATAGERAGVRVERAHDSYPEPVPGDAYVVIPHEFFASSPADGGATPVQLARTVAVCVEQPGTQWFEETVTYAKQLGQVLDIHWHGAAELRRRGVPADHLPLGYAPEWDQWGCSSGSPRPVDVLYMGSEDGRRGRILGAYADTLEPRATRLLIPNIAPKTGPASNYLTGADKHRELARTKVILNLHRTGAAGLLEWPRVLEAISNGCVVVSEHSIDYEPLIPGEHFVSARAQDLALVADALLEDPARLDAIRHRAYQLVRDELTMDHGVGTLIAAADRAARAPGPARAGTIPTTVQLPAAEVVPLPDSASEPALAPVRAALKQLTVEMLGMRRRLEGLERRADPEAGEVQVAAETPAFARARPRISVLVSLYNYEREVIAALSSVSRSSHLAYELIVLDDASTDSSEASVERFFDEHPSLPARLLRHPTNRGLARTRNDLLAAARGDLVLVLDADNEVLPSALIKLESALRNDRDAAFAFGISAVEQDGEVVGLLSAAPWAPSRLAKDNYIDAMALIRGEVLAELGGYCEDIRLTGWEDYDLWLRIAGAGQHAVHVPEIVGRYRRAPHSMLASITDIDTETARSIVRARTPTVFVADNHDGDRRQPLADPADDELSMWLDAPSQGTRVVASRYLVVQGWVAARDCQVDRVVAELGGNEYELRYGIDRADVAAKRPLLRSAARSGFRSIIDLGPLDSGTFHFRATAYLSDGRTLSRAAEICVPGTDRKARRPRAVLGGGPEVWVLTAGAERPDVQRTLASVEAAGAVARTVAELGDQPPPGARHVVLLEAGHELAPDALVHIADACAERDPAALYGDDLFDFGTRVEPFFKPDLSPELLAYTDYVGPLAVTRRDVLATVGARRPAPAGVRDVIAAAHDDGASIVHLPELLCVRRHAGPAVKQNAPGLVSLPRRPLVSIVIPTAAHGRHLERCLGSIAKLTTYESYEVVIVDSSAGRLPDVRAMLAPTDVSVALADTPFNYSDATNRGVHKSRGEYLVLLNDDIEVISEDWLERMLELALRPGVGVVGAKLVRKDGTLQHGGVIIEDQQVRHLYEDLPADNEGYHGLLNAPRNCLAVTGACMMISAALYRWLGGLDPGFVLEYGDIDLCLRARGCSERIAWTPHAVLRHDEFSSRGTDSPVADHALFEARWSTQLAVGDPYSPSLVTHPDSEPRAA